MTDISQYDTEDTSALVWFTIPKMAGKGIWLPPYYTENLDIRVISCNVPVYWKDLFVGVVGIEIDYGMLVRQLESIRVLETGYTFLLDSDSNVIYHPNMDSVQLDLETTAIGHPDEFIGSNHVQYTFEGIRKEAVWIPLSNSMQLYVAAPVSEIESRWYDMIRNTLIASLVILASVCLPAMRFADRLTRPLRDLTEAARQLDQGRQEFSLD